MLLLVDAGNTRIKWALVPADGAPRQWVASGALLHEDSMQLGSQWQVAQISRALLGRSHSTTTAGTRMRKTTSAAQRVAGSTRSSRLIAPRARRAWRAPR